VQTSRGVLLDDEREQADSRLPVAWRGLGGARKVALGAIFLERRDGI
jgi:hypothetical protein